jgi:hypothetical protein
VEGAAVGDILVEGNMLAVVDFGIVVDFETDAAEGIAEVDLENGEEAESGMGEAEFGIVGIEVAAHIVEVGQEGDWEEEEAHLGEEEVGEHSDHVVRVGRRQVVDSRVEHTAEHWDRLQCEKVVDTSAEGILEGIPEDNLEP